MQEIELKQVNITVVYDDLVNAKISNDAIKEEFNNEVVIIDVPDNNLFIDFPEIKSNCKFQSRYDQKRLHVNANFSELQTNLEDYQLDYMLKIVKVLDNAVEDKEKIQAYGFNFDGIVNLEDQDTGLLFKQKFMKSSEQFEESLGGKIIKFAPKFMIEFNDYLISVDLKPGSEEAKSSFRSHFNVHFERNTLPSKSELEREIVNYYKKCREVLGKTELI